MAGTMVLTSGVPTRTAGFPGAGLVPISWNHVGSEWSVNEPIAVGVGFDQGKREPVLRHYAFVRYVGVRCLATVLRDEIAPAMQRRATTFLARQVGRDLAVDLNLVGARREGREGDCERGENDCGFHVQFRVGRLGVMGVSGAPIKRSFSTKSFEVRSVTE